MKTAAEAVFLLPPANHQKLSQPSGMSRGSSFVCAVCNHAQIQIPFYISDRKKDPYHLHKTYRSEVKGYAVYRRLTGNFSDNKYRSEESYDFWYTSFLQKMEEDDFLFNY